MLTLRAAVIFMSALVISTSTGILTWLASHQPATAVIAGGGTFAAAVTFLNKHID